MYNHYTSWPSSSPTTPRNERGCSQNKAADEPSLLVRATDKKLRSIGLNKDYQSERLEARELAKYLIDEYSLNSLLFPASSKASLTSRLQFEQFLRQIINNDPSLKFLEVRSFAELHQPDHYLTRFCDQINGVDIRLCKLPSILTSVQILVQENSYSYIGRFDQAGWGRSAGLKAGDKLLSSGHTHLTSMSYDDMLFYLRTSRDETLEPICFFHRSETSHLTICTPLALKQPFGIVVSEA